LNGIEDPGRIDTKMHSVSEISRERALWAKTKRFLSVPVFSEILQNRIFASIIVIVACVQTGLVAFGLSGWPCPFRSTLGLPCPGCGLSRSLAYLLKGNWNEALHAHAFAPVIFTGFIIMAGLSLLPKKYYSRAVKTIEKYEKASGFVPILLVTMMLYWGARLIELL